MCNKHKNSLIILSLYHFVVISAIVTKPYMQTRYICIVKYCYFKSNDAHPACTKIYSEYPQCVNHVLVQEMKENNLTQQYLLKASLIYESSLLNKAITAAQLLQFNLYGLPFFSTAIAFRHSSTLLRTQSVMMANFRDSVKYTLSPGSFTVQGTTWIPQAFQWSKTDLRCKNRGGK